MTKTRPENPFKQTFTQLLAEYQRNSNAANLNKIDEYAKTVPENMRTEVLRPHFDFAMRNDFGEIGKIFIKNGMDVDFKDPYAHNYTALDIAVDARDASVVKEVISHSKDPTSLVNNPDNLGNTPLHRATKLAQYNIANDLIDNGADLKAKDTNGKTPIDVAKEPRNDFQREHKKNFDQKLAEKIGKNSNVNIEQVHIKNNSVEINKSKADNKEVENLKSSKVQKTLGVDEKGKDKKLSFKERHQNNMKKMAETHKKNVESIKKFFSNLSKKSHSNDKSHENFTGKTPHNRGKGSRVK
ncbi:MAG: ankyrin repeat domain-containing protein [Sphingobacteriia bacterium]|nr:ankyrin repeat domain-containing protein [Sphingobacteriia bacterium]